MKNLKNKKNCSLGASCKNSCISKDKNCIPALPQTSRIRVKAAVEKLQTSIMQVKANTFIKSGKISEASGLIERFMGRNTTAEAEAITAKIKVDKALVQDVTDFNQLTGKSLAKLKEIKFSPERSYADVKDGLIVIDSRTDLSRRRAAVFHEMGHFLERSDPKLMSASREFVEARATGPKEPLRKILKDNRYAETEYAYPGPWITAYVGKTYISGATEVVSIGLEHFASPLALSKLAKADPLHAEFIARILEPVP